jgi:hypothetical protein
VAAHRPNINLILILLLIFLFMVMAGDLFGREEFFSGERSASTLLGFLGLIIILLLFFRLMAQPPSIPKTRIITVLKCEKCNVKNVRDFKQGDYIPKQEGKCPGCEGPMYVEAIYPEELPKKKPKFRF